MEIYLREKKSAILADRQDVTEYRDNDDTVSHLSRVQNRLPTLQDKLMSRHGSVTGSVQQELKSRMAEVCSQISIRDQTQITAEQQNLEAVNETPLEDCGDQWDLINRMMLLKDHEER